MPIQHVSEHIKFVFAYKPDVIDRGCVNERYVFAFLTDSGRVFFENMFDHGGPRKKTQDLPGFDVVRYTNQVIWVLFNSMNKILLKYEMDENTEVVFAGMTALKKYDQVYSAWKFASSFKNFYLSTTKMYFVHNRIAAFHEDKTMTRVKHDEILARTVSSRSRVLTKLLLRDYEKLEISGACPWINSEMAAKLQMAQVKEQIFRKLAVLGLWFCAVRKYYRAYNTAAGNPVKLNLDYEEAKNE